MKALQWMGGGTAVLAMIPATLGPAVAADRSVARTPTSENIAEGSSPSYVATLPVSYDATSVPTLTVANLRALQRASAEVALREPDGPFEQFGQHARQPATRVAARVQNGLELPEPGPWSALAATFFLALFFFARRLGL